MAVIVSSVLVYFFEFQGYDAPMLLQPIIALLNVVLRPGVMAVQLAACLIGLCSFDAPGFVIALGGVALQCYLLFVLDRFGWFKVRSRSPRNTARRT